MSADRMVKSLFFNIFLLIQQEDFLIYKTCLLLEMQSANHNKNFL